MYRHSSLLRLAELIAHKGNRQALCELHNNRTVFYYHNDGPLRLAEFVDELRQSKAARRWCNREDDVLERAYDLTISKFSHLPDPEKNDRPVKEDGPDCRYYYKAFIEHVAVKMETESYSNEAKKEIRVAGLLQNFVIRHFHLSCLECGRTGRALSRRYLWKLNGYILSIFMPLRIPGSQCSRWLAEHIPDVDPSRAGERDRVQAIVDRLLSRQKILSLDGMNENEMAADSPPCRCEIERQIAAGGLAGAVADEKADHIERQRPAIRHLGKEKLKNLIHQIFESLARGEYEATGLARSAGISPSTFSRFAGSRWSSETGNSKYQPVPDLWNNTAETLAGQSVFVEAAQAAGVWKRVEQIIGSSDARRNGA